MRGKKNALAITMGDPSGVGPEVIVKALPKRACTKAGPFLIVGSRAVLERAADLCKVPTPSVPILDPFRLNRRRLKKQAPSMESGKASLAYIEKGIALAKKGIVDGIVTAPISKEALALAGSPFKGHTELVAKRAGGGPPVMFFAGPGLRVALVTTHIPLKKVPAAITKEKILHTIRVTAKALETGFGEKKPNLAILSLNPHAGESGLLGTEEKEILLPAIRAAGKERIRCEGPFPADTAFLAENRRRFSAFVAMYHDQALLAVKLLLFRKSVNITLGTGIIRTSVDHGTAYPLAGKGIADPASMIQAIKMARQLANRQGEKK